MHLSHPQSSWSWHGGMDSLAWGRLASCWAPQRGEFSRVIRGHIPGQWLLGALSLSPQDVLEQGPHPSGREGPRGFPRSLSVPGGGGQGRGGPATLQSQSCLLCLALCMHEPRRVCLFIPYHMDPIEIRPLCPALVWVEPQGNAESKGPWLTLARVRMRVLRQSNEEPVGLGPPKWPWGGQWGQASNPGHHGHTCLTPMGIPGPTLPPLGSCHSSQPPRSQAGRILRRGQRPPSRLLGCGSSPEHLLLGMNTPVPSGDGPEPREGMVEGLPETPFRGQWCSRQSCGAGDKPRGQTFIRCHSLIYHGTRSTTPHGPQVRGRVRVGAGDRSAY